METHTKNVLMCPHKSLSDCCSREWSGFFFIKSNATYIIEQGNVLFNNWVFTNANFFVCAQFEYFEMNVSITNTALHGDGSTNFTSKKRNSLKDHEWYSLCCRSYLPTGSRPSNRHNFLFWFSKRNLPNQICTWWSFAAQFFFVCLSRLRCCVGGERDISALFASINCDAYTIGLFEVLLGLHNWTLASVAAVSRLFVLH